MTEIEAEAQRRVYWSAMRETCREIRRTGLHVARGLWLAAHDNMLRDQYEKWCEAYEFLRAERIKEAA